MLLTKTTCKNLGTTLWALSPVRCWECLLGSIYHINVLIHYMCSATLKYD